ncbi:hypothetical protein TERTU_0680 [Teredinibacter turnerae T7901]|uniref:Uncharacterized protein n=1 Tax=Teredinibacter turnerae (strain ATCC 39867 / T7901) TaxID=377629 RepID=C5BNU9_TERTT|nr:hypothetical protein TERTU_0680 [Teredinibacter turnerae T7901]
MILINLAMNVAKLIAGLIGDNPCVTYQFLSAIKKPVVQNRLYVSESLN